MEITSRRLDDVMEVQAKGRLDAYWADHLSQALEEIMRQGNDRIRVNLSEVVYISSMGIRVLMTFYRKVAAINGSFSVSDPSEAVKKVLDMAGLRKTLMAAATPSAPAPEAPPVPAVRELDRANARFEVHTLGTGAMKCRTMGDAKLLDGCRFRAEHCAPTLFPESSFALGLGAFGGSFEECKERFGEFLSVAGAAAYQPSDGSNAPDFLLAEGTFAPELQVLYGMSCEGTFASLARFESKPDAPAAGLAELADAALEMSGSDRVCMVMIAESAGLVGASLRKPPVNGAGSGAPFQHPEIRKWLSFTTERAFPRALTVVVGVAARKAEGEWSHLLRPLKGGEGAPVGHFHAAPFTYRPLPRGVMDLRQTIRSLFAEETLLGLLHLIGDDRESSGVSESEFVRGACWVSPVSEVSSLRS